MIFTTSDVGTLLTSAYGDVSSISIGSGPDGFVRGEWDSTLAVRAHAIGPPSEGAVTSEQPTIREPAPIRRVRWKETEYGGVLLTWVIVSRDALQWRRPWSMLQRSKNPVMMSRGHQELACPTCSSNIQPTLWVIAV